MENVNLIMNNLWLGNLAIAYDEEFIKNNNIKLIVHCLKNTEIPTWYEKYNIEIVKLEINDYNGKEENEVLKQNINFIIDKIDQYRLTNQSVLVHCYAGMQRSATVIASYLIKKYNFNAKNAIIFTQFKRSIAFRPKPTFENFILNL